MYKKQLLSAFIIALVGNVMSASQNVTIHVNNNNYTMPKPALIRELEAAPLAPVQNQDLKPINPSAIITARTLTTVETQMPSTIKPLGFLQQSYNAITAHPYMTAGVLAATCYVGLVTTRYCLERAITEHNQWTFWHEEVAVATMTESDQEKLRAEVFEIFQNWSEQHKNELYMQLSGLSPMFPIFLQEIVAMIEQEVERLNSLARFEHIMERTYLCRIVPQGGYTLDWLEEKVQRLTLLEEYLHSWVLNAMRPATPCLK